MTGLAADQRVYKLSGDRGRRVVETTSIGDGNDPAQVELRRTKAAMIYPATGNVRAIQILFGHMKVENTVRYLGVDIEDASS